MPGRHIRCMAGVMLAFQGRLLKRAMEIAGGARPLGLRLGVDEHTIVLWLEGKATMPARIFLIAADLVLEDDIARARQDRRQQPRSSFPAGMSANSSTQTQPPGASPAP